MSFMSWQTDYQVGVAEIDNQHRRLVEMVNSLHEAMKSGSGKTLVPKLLNGLVEYTVSHFSTEERLMQETRYPEYSLYKVGQCPHSLVRVFAFKGVSSRAEEL